VCSASSAVGAVDEARRSERRLTRSEDEEHVPAFEFGVAFDRRYIL
jgi:hypothetical protein